MKKIILYIFLCLNFTLSAQNKDTWISFWDKDTTHLGFKDKSGNIKIEPRFMGFTIAHKFENIIAVSEEENENWKSYYLTKTGKIVGRDSLYVFDNGPDCENEGFIRFNDPKTDKMGLFNGDGKIVIPAEYSDLTRVRNGMIIALKDAVKEKDGEHFFWTGGKEFLIDINNKILIENFGFNDELNFYSLEKSKEKNPDPVRDNFLGVDGQYYSFINFDKEFKEWLKNILLTDLSKENLLKHSYDEITYWKKKDDDDGWITKPKEAFMKLNYKLIKAKLLELKSTNCDYHIFSESLNKFIFEADEYDQYFDNCRQAKDWINPVKNIVISPQNKNESGQDHFEFLRTKNGYKLISASSRKEDLK
ncbi:WG repeat-containing protein [Flavobacterium pectinovorum]|uniref:WG containing repeat-containing protein n=1 Tax=Flavobacterium pectinovorum TaxID=29533 RepID=A0ABY1J378_9FLAO|nr:WG repeat-containing protein [Flavobacterium pectinovorum]SHM18166.1 WG containing repeat-containing protein [Flavobacterium pectinovorum]